MTIVKYKNSTRIFRNGRYLLGGSSCLMKIRESFYDGEGQGLNPSLFFYGAIIQAITFVPRHLKTRKGF
jgi:hypothetical protein